MKKNRRLSSDIAILITVGLLFYKTDLPAGIGDFKKDFENTENQKKEESQKPAANQTTASPASADSPKAAPSNGAPPAQSDNNLRKFYNDFNPPKGGPTGTNNTQPSSPGYNPYYYNYYDYPPDYYRYNYPYYYPYYNYNEPAVIVPSTPAQPNTRVQYNPETSQIVEQERYTWYNATLQSQYISDTLSSVGMIFSIISAGRIDTLSYGVKYDYNLFTEKNDDERVSLPLSYMGLVIGKQLGTGLTEVFIAYANLNGMGGLSMKLSTDQFIQKYVFVTAGLGVSIINSSPLTDMSIGIGLAGSLAQFTVGYRKQSSVSTDLKGPEIKMSLIF